MGGGGNRQPTFSAKARKNCSREKKRSRLYNRLVEQPGRPERPPLRRAEQRRSDAKYQPNRTASKYLAIKREERHMDENVTITRDYSRNQPSDSTMSHQILHVKVELRTRRTITITITKGYSRNQSSDNTMSHLPRTAITITITMKCANISTYYNYRTRGL